MKIKVKFGAMTICLAILFSGLSSCDAADSDLQLVVDGSTVATTGTVVSKTDALDVAAAFSAERFGKYIPSRSRSEDAIEAIKNVDGDEIAYVVNFADGGWVMVSATREYHPILAHSNDTDVSFDIKNLDKNVGFEIWLDEINADMESATGFDSITTAQIANEWLQYTSQPQDVGTVGGGGPGGIPGGNSEAAVACRNRLKYLNETYYQDGWTFQVLSNVTQVTIPNYVYENCEIYTSPRELTIVGLKDVSRRSNTGPLLTTTWDQEHDFNALCPGTPAGCVTIAVAQIMNYHKYPNRFDWGKMYDHTATAASQTLVKDIRDVLGLGSDDTGSNIGAAKDAFAYYGYSAEKKDHKNMDVVYEVGGYERPVYMRGAKGFLRGGHAWVCDGVIRVVGEYLYYVEYLNSVNEYTNRGETLMENPGTCGGTSYMRFHMNWGWYGLNDGWYVEPASSDFDYTYNRQNLYVRPN